MHILILSDQGFEEAELLVPFYRLQEPAWRVTVASPRGGPLQGKHGYPFRETTPLRDVDPESVGAWVVPGGQAPARLASRDDALSLVRRLAEREIPLAAICHGPLLLARAGVVSGRRLTAYPRVWPELTAAGATVEDAPAVVDGLWVSARRPADIPQWMARFIALMPP